MNDKHRHDFCLPLGDRSIGSTEKGASPGGSRDLRDRGSRGRYRRLTLAKTLKGELDNGEEGINELRGGTGRASHRGL